MAFLACRTDGLLWFVGQALVWACVLIGAVYDTLLPGVAVSAVVFIAAFCVWGCDRADCTDLQAVGYLLFMLFCIFALTTAAILPALT